MDCKEDSFGLKLSFSPTFLINFFDCHGELVKNLLLPVFTYPPTEEEISTLLYFFLLSTSKFLKPVRSLRFVRHSPLNDSLLFDMQTLFPL